MNKLASLFLNLVVSSTVSSVVGTVISRNLPIPKSIGDKLVSGIGTFLITSMAAHAAVEYVNEEMLKAKES
jgi:hypothetical protein